MDAHEYTSRVRAIETKLYRCAKCILKNDTDAADAVQEALLSAWRNLSSLRNEEYFETWLIRIVINECKRLIKKKNLLREEALSPTLTAPPEEEKNVYTFLMQLDEKYRLPIMLYHIQGYDVQSIARILSLPSGTVKTRLARGRERLKKLIGQEAEA
ncbi:MAG: sigma-70 family RNA polymerase sigma factor [Clostridia bacterium]|nr:sigma-70 family RNA polymerase sigma factor [Clostridia bacterium]